MSQVQPAAPPESVGPAAPATASRLPIDHLDSAVVRNPKAVVAFLFGVLALAFLAAGAAVPQFRDDIEPLEALVVVPAGFVAGLVAIGLARRARFDYQRTLGRAGGDGLAVAARFLGLLAVLISLTAGLAVGVYAVLVLVQG